MPDQEEDTVESPTTVATGKLAELLSVVTKVDPETGKQANPVAVLVAILFIVLAISGVGIAVALTRRKAVKAQFELDRVTEEAKRKEVALEEASMEASRVVLQREITRLQDRAEELRGELAAHEVSHVVALAKLNAVSTWDDLEVRRAP